jgi:hypothetical protein|tara:strand:+ start:133 stop:315 length:183 start_codon:yes stop_codon:yes gene_type:complete
MYAEYVFDTKLTLTPHKKEDAIFLSERNHKIKVKNIYKLSSIISFLRNIISSGMQYIETV